MAKVSVVLPVYNVEKYLSTCADSLISQTLEDIQIIFVDDGSTDKSVEIIKSYAEKDKRVQLITQKNSFAGVARNNGLKAVNGEYVIFLDSDDFFDSDMLLEMYNKAKEDNADVCLCSAKKYDESTGETTYPKFYLNTSNLPETLPFSAKDINERIFNFTSPSPWTKLFKTSFVRKNGLQFQATKKTNDLFFVYSNLALADRITYVEKPFVTYRTGNADSIQGSIKSVTLDFYTALIALKEELVKRKLFSTFEKSYVNRALSTALFGVKCHSNVDDFVKVAEFLKNEGFINLTIIGHTRPYFYNRNDFTDFIDIMDLPGEEAYEKFNTPEVPLPPKVDLDKWTAPIEVVEDGSIKFSVIIPVYNTAPYIEECLDSVLASTLKDFEVICVNDGSKDNSLEVLKSVAERDSRIVILDQENSGISITRNNGLNIARGEYVMFLDSDDYIHEKALEYLYTEAKKDNLDQLFFTAASFFDDGYYTDALGDIDRLYQRKHIYPEVITGSEFFAKSVERGEFKPSACLLATKKAFLDEHSIRFLEGVLHEDNYFMFQTLFFSQRVRCDNVVLYYRRVRDNSIMTGTSLVVHMHYYYKIVMAIQAYAKEQHYNQNKEFFNALLKQLSVMTFTAADMAHRATDEEFNDFIYNLDEANAINFYNQVYAAMRIRESVRVSSANARNNFEKAKVVGYKNAAVIKENRELIKQNNALIKENERLRNENNRKEIQIVAKILRVLNLPKRVLKKLFRKKK